MGHNVPSCYDYLHTGDGYDTDNAAKFDQIVDLLPEDDRNVWIYNAFALGEIYTERQAKSWLFLLMQFMTASADVRAEMVARGEMIQHLWEWQTFTKPNSPALGSKTTRESAG